MRRTLPLVSPLALTTALALALTVSGCIGPRPVAPPEAFVTPPPTWRAPSVATDAVDTQWWTGFHDPVLSDLIQRALARNAQIGEAVARVEQARAQLRLAHGEQGPEIDFDGIGGYTRQLEVTGPLTTTAAKGGGAIAWDLDFFGRLRNASKAARAQMLASEGARDAVALAIASTTAQTYIALLGDDRRLAIAEQTLEARAASLKLARRLADSGYSSRLELSQAEAEYRATEQLIPQARLAITQTENALSVLVGSAPGAIPRNPGGLDALGVPAVASGLPSQLLRRRPDIYAAEEALVVADRSLDSARAAMLPDIALTGSADKIYADVLPASESTFLIGASVLAPIFDSGRRRAAANGAAAKRDEAAYAYRDTVLEAFKEVENAVAAVGEDEAQRNALLGQVSAEQSVLKIATERYRAGYASYLDQIDAERALLSAQLSLTQVEAARLGAYVDLYRALGGGWKAPIPDTGK